MSHGVELQGFAQMFRQYVQRSDRQLLQDFKTFLVDQHLYHDLLMREVERVPRRQVEILELGPGSGCTTTLVSTWPRTRVLAVDLLPEALACTARTLKLCGGRLDRVHPVVADGTRLPCREGSVDLLYHQGLLEHFRDTAPLMSEMCRVLRPGGGLVINVPQTYSWYTVKKWAAQRRGTWSPGWETSFSGGGLRTLAERYGLDLVKVRGQTYDSKWNELRKGYQRWFRPWLPASLDSVWTRAWGGVLERHGHRFLLEIIGVFRKR